MGLKAIALADNFECYDTASTILLFGSFITVFFFSSVVIICGVLLTSFEQIVGPYSPDV